MTRDEEDALIAQIAADQKAFPLEDHTVEEIVVTAMRLAIRAAVAAERERCAKEADAEASVEGIAQRIAAAIRRGE